MAAESFLRHPSEQKFYTVLAFVMGLLGLNTHFWSWYNYPPYKLYAVQRKVVIVFIPVTVASLTFYMFRNYKDYDFKVIASMMSVIPFAMCLTCKVMSAQTESYKTAHTDFMDKVHLHSFYIQLFPRKKQKFIKNLLLKVEKNTRIMFYALNALGVICCTAWVFFPAMHNYQNNESIHNITTRLELGIYLWQPFDYEYNIYGYFAVQILTTYCSYIGTFIWVVFDTINVAYVFHLTGHLHIFKYDLMMGQDEDMSDADWEKRLKEIFIRYFFITKTFKNIEKAYGLNISSIYAQNLLVGGLLLYMFINSGSDLGVILTYGLQLPMFMGTLVVLSAVIENVRIQADDLSNLIYALPWETMSIRNRKLLQFILFQVQPPMEYIAAFNIKAGVQPAIYILKTTFSYYVMIKSRKEMQKFDS